MTDADSKENSKGTLDLGLTQLASRESSLDVSSYVTALEQSRKDASSDSSDDKEVDLDSTPCMTGNEALDHAIEGEHWKKVISESDSWFSKKKEENHRIRLWWLYAQMQEEQMPPSLLTAPLESVGEALQKESDDTEALSFLELIAIELSEKLCAAGDTNLAVSVHELLFALNDRHESAYRELFDSLIHQERERIGPRSSRDIKDRVKRLEERYEKQFGESYTEAVVVEEELLEDKESVSAEIIEKRPSSSSSAILYILLLFFLCGATYWSGILDSTEVVSLVDSARSPTEIETEAYGTFAFQVPAPSVKFPETAIVDVMRKPSLNGILKELDKQLANPSSVISQVTQSSPVVRTKAVSPQNGASTAQAATKASDKGKKALDMSGPAEPRTVSEIIRDRNQVPQSHSPRVPQRLYSGQLRGESRGNTIVSGYPTIPRFGRDRQLTEGRGEPYFYRIVYETPVKSAPSDASQTIGYLKIGNKVEVGERIGPWLRIVSSRSRSGYILANTAQPVNN